jgi:hypothetical protein
MRRALVVGTAASLVGLAAAAAAVVGGEDVQTQAPDPEGVRAAVSAYYAALNARDIRAMEAVWSRDAEPIMIHPTGPHARAPAIGRSGWLCRAPVDGSAAVGAASQCRVQEHRQGGTPWPS